MVNLNSSLLDLRKFVAPEFIFGVNARNLTGRYALNLGGRKAMLVTDQNLLLNTSWVQQIEQSLQSVGMSYFVFNTISPNPRAAEVMAGAALFAQEHCNILVAIGGGSVMDCAKGIGIIASNGGHILDYEGVDRITHPLPPLICIPTTSGTASEVSQFTIILDTTRKIKIAIVSKTLVPDIGLIDPEITTTMNPYITACTGMDALTHAIEAYVSNASSPITDLFALEAIRLLWTELPQVLVDPLCLDKRATIMLGSLHAGLAFSNAILGAVHAMAHSLGGLLDLPHGECNAILLAPVIAYNYPACPSKFNNIANILGLTLNNLSTNTAARQLSEEINTYRYKLGIVKSLQDLGVAKKSIPILAKHALQDACMATNPLSLNQTDVEVIYERAF